MCRNQTHAAFCQCTPVYLVPYEQHVSGEVTRAEKIDDQTVSGSPALTPHRLLGPQRRWKRTFAPGSAKGTTQLAAKRSKKPCELALGRHQPNAARIFFESETQPKIPP